MYRSSKYRIAIVFAVGVGLVAINCGGGNGSSGPSLNSAWQKFEAGEYDAAIAEFTDFVNETSDPATRAEGYCGLGWSYAFNGDLESADASFQSALDTGVDRPDIAAGASAVDLALGELDDAIGHAQTALLTMDPGWSFEHYPGIDALDCRLILAQAYFGRGGSSLADAQAEVDILDPDNGLDPEDSESWGTYPTYETALLRKIQELEETIGAELLI